MRRITLVLCLILPALAWGQVNWKYRDHPDPMGRGVTHIAAAVSNSPITFSSPYGGAQYATLMLRRAPRGGGDVLLSFRRAHFLCHSDCSVLVRFDEKRAERCMAVQPNDHSTDAIFLNCYGRFVKELRTAKKLRIEALFYQDGNRVMEFDVGGLVWAEPEAKKSTNKEREVLKITPGEQALNRCAAEAGAKIAGTQDFVSAVRECFVGTRAQWGCRRVAMEGKGMDGIEYVESIRTCLRPSAGTKR
ncbi:MAG: hypothetical protein PHU07_13605 [Acidocella sp.]|nr:hypothetical protein [Acidocella sp.]